MLVATPEPLATVPRGVLDLGELAESIPRGVSRNLERELGVTLDQFDSIQALIAELLILHGDNRPRGSRARWRPLKQDHRGWHRIRMLGATLYEAPVPQGTTITESFNTTDSSTLGPDLTWTEWEDASVDLSVVSNEAKLTGTNTDQNGVARAESNLASDDHYVQFDVTSDNSDDPDGNVQVRARLDPSTSSLATHTSYGAIYRGGNGVRLSKTVNGSVTHLTAFSSITRTLPDVLRVEVDGSALTSYWSGTEINSTTDTDITTHVRTGIQFFKSAASADYAIDNFEAGDLGAGGTTVTTDAARIWTRAGTTELNLTGATIDTQAARLHVRSGETDVVIGGVTVDTQAARVHTRSGVTELDLTGATADTAAARIHARSGTTEVATGSEIDTSAARLRTRSGVTEVTIGAVNVTTEAGRISLRSAATDLELGALEIDTDASRLRTRSGTTQIATGLVLDTQAARIRTRAGITSVFEGAQFIPDVACAVTTLPVECAVTTLPVECEVET